MPTVHVVKQGECLASIAKDYGFHDWKVIWDDPANADLKNARKNANVIFPGDEVVVPDPKESNKNESCGTEKRHKFQIKLPKTWLRIALHDEDDKPLSGKSFRLEIGDDQYEGTTDGDGVVEQAVSPTAVNATLTLFLTSDKAKGERYVWDVSIGHLDPIESVEGAQARLNNLGYPAGPTDGDPGPRTEAALRTFQKDAGLTVTGDYDDATKNKLLELHGKS
jgi:N-acetylmuramoyl-L-alanine amidase